MWDLLLGAYTFKIVYHLGKFILLSSYDIAFIYGNFLFSA